MKIICALEVRLSKITYIIILLLISRMMNGVVQINLVLFSKSRKV